MSRLNEIMDNHKNLDQLMSLFKHYGVNAEFVTAAVLHEFKKQGGGQPGDEHTAKLLEDLNQFHARF